MDERQDPNPDPPQDRLSDLPYKKRFLGQEEPAAPGGDEGDAADDDAKDDAADAAAVDATTARNLCDDILSNKRRIVQELQQQAYVSVLRAFMAESRDFTSNQVLILKELTKDFKITYRQHLKFVEEINNDTLTRELRGDNPQEIGQKALTQEAKPGTSTSQGTSPSSSSSSSAPPEDKEKEVATPLSAGNRPSSSSSSADKGKEVATPSSPGKRPTPQPPSSSAGGSSKGSWGKASPESLIGRKVFVRLPGDDEFIEFIIKKYDAEKELHYFEDAADTMEDPCSWIDIRQIPSEDIMWEGGDPGISEDECPCKPGQTLLHVTSTTGCKGGPEDDVFKIPPLPANYATGNEADAAGDLSLQLSLSSSGYYKSDAEVPEPHGTNTKEGKSDDEEGNKATR